ncbi:hypothetical protein [Streptomyces axinellae]|uniref:DUF1795 domain-containing protein n=1 Tax=Streptomyces axinellae TaxID=552788 RepID=A0ABN3R1K5_9ACTN
MPTALPLPLEFRLPDSWRPAPPDSVGAPGVAFVAVHAESDAGFTANISIDGEYRPDDALLADLADASVQRMQEVAESVRVTDRSEVGSADAPGLAQTMAFSALTGDSRRDLLQSQVYLSMLDTGDPRKRAVIRLTLTATALQHASVAEDFRELVRSVRPETGAAS